MPADHRATVRALLAEVLALGELRRLAALARRRWAQGARPWGALGVATGAVVVNLLLGKPTVGPALWRAGDVYASLPWTTELLRLPMSLVLPTPYLPVWGAVLQLAVVLGLAELVLGRWLTAAVAVLGHVAATLGARVLIDLGYLPAALAHVLDTGPSAAVTAVGACVLVVLGMRHCTFLLTAALLIALAVAPGIDGVEHAIALGCGLGAGALAQFGVSYRWPLLARLGQSGVTRSAHGELRS